ncbi:phage baseplate protein [Rhodospirillum sp. A1_3_36]|uniref:phage baseplate protein n=1 Tax=Rhodospirillum sp. A1_3_36 TaxID=3391666 RepID=UPI0039A43B20
MSWAQQTEPVTVMPERHIGGLTADVVIEETHEDGLEVTEFPVEQGAVISDHAYLKPQSLVLRIGASDSGADATEGAKRSQEFYDKLRELQGRREPFDVVTGKRLYSNMLVISISTTTDADTENAFIATVELREVIIVSTSVTTVPPRARHRSGNQTGGVSDKGKKQPQKESALQKAFG